MSKKGILGVLGNTKAMKQAQKTMDSFGNAMKEMQQGSLQQLFSSFIEVLNSPMLVALDITIAKLNEQLMPLMMPLMEDIASGKFDPLIDSLVEAFKWIQIISVGPLIQALEGINALIVFLSNLSSFGGPPSEEALEELFPEGVPEQIRQESTAGQPGFWDRRRRVPF